MATIHPYKGYLNTKFRITAKGDSPISYKIFSKSNDTTDCVSQGKVTPNEPHEVVIPYAGEFVIQFDNGDQHEFVVEDGYRYGGNKLKKAFIFDNCPWAFVVMHDRTYFYNRQTQESYVEPVSPDEITEISPDYVLLKSESHDEFTLYSLERQQPVLWVDNVAFHSENVLCWEEHDENDDHPTLILYSLSEQRTVSRITCDKYSFDKKSISLFYHTSAQIHKIDLITFEDSSIHKYDECLKFVTFVCSHYAVSYAALQSKLFILDIVNNEPRGEVMVQGNLARVNDVSFIDIPTKTHDFRNFIFESFCIPEATIQAQYTEIDLYPCDWEINESYGCKFRTLYAEKLISLYVSQGKYRNNYSRTEESCIKSIETDYFQSIDNVHGSVICSNKYFHFFNRNESLVIPHDYPHLASYHKGKLFLQVGRTVMMKCDDEVRFLTDRGFWDRQMVGKFDISYIEPFMVLKNEDDNIYYSIDGTEMGKFKCCINSNFKCLDMEDYTVYPGGSFITSPNRPHFISPNGRYGLTISETEVTLLTIRLHKVSTSSQIMQDIYDTKKYTNVLFGENGKQIIYRDNKHAKILDLETSETIEFDNLSYINHINGIRPYFRLLETSQALLINPVNGQPIDFDLVNEYQFVSPDYQFYADKALDKYIEYFDQIQQRLISKEQYLDFYKKFNLSIFDETKRDEIVQNRKDFVQKHSDFLIDILRGKGYRERSIEEFQEYIIDEKNFFGIESFLSLFIEKRGIAVIRRISDKSEVARIPLGPPLWFLNYVSFSKDSKYAAIAGRYPDGSNYSGLFLVYDLVEQKTIIEDKSSYAVWLTSFADDDIVAAYTSTPNSFLGNATNPPKAVIENERYPKDVNFNIRGFNFLTFSPDGKYYACSHQGYLRYRRPDGTKRANWGHQPSSLVSIRYTSNPQEELITLNDLSEEGIADTNIKQSVASVSFSNDNSRIMMVGRNGVVVVRNIYL